ncbi:hypothetical protein ACFQ21_00200 [Ohtaekwangia kribbensis]|uniref:Uncharacterized protein n=1 Tax=Ohtaekwangia kribbensis TaxID=688913 RepID=A0ABW3JUS4_9BACT
MTIIPKEFWLILEGEKKPTIECPMCGCFLLSDIAPHGIREDGSVYNSVVCDCGFHEYVKLEGWTGGHIERTPKKK